MEGGSTLIQKVIELKISCYQNSTDFRGKYFYVMCQPWLGNSLGKLEIWGKVSDFWCCKDEAKSKKIFQNVQIFQN